MPPNIVEPGLQGDPENGANTVKPSAPSENEVEGPQASQHTQGSYNLKTFQSVMNLLAHILIGAVVGIVLIFAFQYGLPMGATLQHIVLCVLGYQLLMAQAILSLSPSNGWSSHLKLVHKKRAHWILQIVGSALAIAGSFVKIIDKSVHWNTLHGKFALVALVFTVLSLINGVTSLWAFEMRRFLPMNLSKLTHIIFGIVAFVSASICLCYGLEKRMFTSWVTEELAYTTIGFTAAFTFIIIIDPCITFVSKSMRAVRR